MPTGVGWATVTGAAAAAARRAVGAAVWPRRVPRDVYLYRSADTCTDPQRDRTICGPMSWARPHGLLLETQRQEQTMTKLILDLSISLDGFVAGRNQTLEQPLGEGGERLHEWVFALESWRKPHGLEGGERNVDGDVVQESVDATGAVVMGRRMFSGGAGRWADDPNADGWWGDNPPFHVPVFVLTHHARETEVK